MNKLFFLSLIILLTSCTKTRAGQEPVTFVLPDIPSSLTEPAERADYLAQHYWDNVDFSSNAWLTDSLVLEQAFVDFIDLLPHVSSNDCIYAAMTQLVKDASVNDDAVKAISHYAEKYLYETASPLLNEEAYQQFIYAMIRNTYLPQSQFLRYDDTLRQIKRNRPGLGATDILINSQDEQLIFLRKLMNGLPTIVIFYDPDCTDCQQLLSTMSTDQRLLTVLKEGKMKVIAIDVTGNSVFKGAGTLKNWIWTSAPTDVSEAYTWRRLPSLYLISSDFKVLMKDRSFDHITQSIFH